MFRTADFMTKDPITVEPEEKISAVIDLMKFHHIHRIPVVDEKNHLKGLITEGMIGDDNAATSLSIYELNYLLSKTDVKTVMEKHPIYIEDDALMEEATQKLLKHDIGCLPVVNKAGEVVGILTQNDIFKAFLNMLGWEIEGTRLIVRVHDDVGALARLSQLFADNGISISNVSVYAFVDDGARILIKTNGKAPESFKDILNDKGYEVLEWD